MSLASFFMFRAEIKSGHHQETKRRLYHSIDIFILRPQPIESNLPRPLSRKLELISYRICQNSLFFSRNRYTPLHLVAVQLFMLYGFLASLESFPENSPI